MMGSFGKLKKFTGGAIKKAKRTKTERRRSVNKGEEKMTTIRFLSVEEVKELDLNDLKAYTWLIFGILRMHLGKMYAMTNVTYTSPLEIDEFITQMNAIARICDMLEFLFIELGFGPKGKDL